MVAEIDIYRSAQVLIDNHGEMAAIEAGKRADAFLDAGNMDGVRIWK